MAVLKQGGGPNPPVQLDPVQTIVNVHWPARFTHLSVLFQINFRREDSGNIELGCTPFDTADEAAFYANQYLVSSGYKFPDGSTGPTIIGRRKDGTWSGVPSNDVELEGMPELPVDFAVAAWTWPIGFLQQFTFDSNTDDGPVYTATPVNPVHQAALHWVAPTGADLDIELTSGDHFKDSLDAKVVTRSDPFDGAPLCIKPIGISSRRWAASGMDNPQTFNDFQPVTAMTAVYEGETYTAVGSFLSDDGIHSDKTLFILLEKQGGTD